ncbi:ependymin [Scleropages formosus]|uniref:Ependymin-like n=1 Tax=Scleropages formosus TaxID=113540 RepID=A0A8C9SLF1_SCLFO|nr:ependymin-like [Scleropages formosus]
MQSLVAISLTLILAAAFTGAQKPHPCKSPPLMVGRLSALNPKGHVAAYERFSYDALERRIRVRALVFVDNSTMYEEALLLFREGVLYEIFHQNQTCKRSELKEPFQPIEVPHDAQLLGQLILGSSSAPGSGLLVNSWEKSVPEIKTKFFMTFTEFACIPVSIASHTENTGWTMTSFYDLVIGIEDPDEFIPPPFCEKAEVNHKSAKSLFNFLG